MCSVVRFLPALSHGINDLVLRWYWCRLLDGAAVTADYGATAAAGAAVSTPGQGGTISFMLFPADLLGATETVTVGAGGSGGIAGGAAFSNGLASKFGSNIYLFAAVGMCTNQQGQGWPSQGAAGFAFDRWRILVQFIRHFRAWRHFRRRRCRIYECYVTPQVATAGVGNAPPAASSLVGIANCGHQKYGAISGGAAGTPNWVERK